MARRQSPAARGRKAIREARKKLPGLGRLLDMVRGTTWVQAAPPAAPTTSDSSGDAKAYLSSYDYCAKL